MHYSSITWPLWIVMLVRLPCGIQTGQARFCLTKAVLLLNQSGYAVRLAQFGTLASPRLVFVVWIVFLVLQPQPLSLLHKGTPLCFREKSDRGSKELVHTRTEL